MNPMEIEMDRDLDEEDWVSKMEREGRVVWENEVSEEEWDKAKKEMRAYPKYYIETYKVEDEREVEGIISINNGEKDYD